MKRFALEILTAAIVTFCLCYPIAAYVFDWPR
jgi:hypothetical protein